MFLDTLIENAHQALFRYPEAIDYLQSRKISVDDIRTYKLGFSKLIGVPEEDSADRKRFMEECGRGRWLQNKIIFPYRDEIGRFVGLVGRAIETKEFKVFVTEKAKLDGFFFGLYDALPHIYKENRVYVVEGPFDYLALSRVLPNTVASLTAGFSEPQYNYLNLFCDRIVTVFDSDEPGKRASERVAEEYKNISSMSIGNYKDPAKCWESMSLSAFKKHISKNMPFL